MIAADATPPLNFRRYGEGPYFSGTVCAPTASPVFDFDWSRPYDERGSKSVAAPERLSSWSESHFVRRSA